MVRVLIGILWILQASARVIEVGRRPSNGGLVTCEGAVLRRARNSA